MQQEYRFLLIYRAIVYSHAQPASKVALALLSKSILLLFTLRRMLHNNYLPACRAAATRVC
jgi:hypothetical protein